RALPTEALTEASAARGGPVVDGRPAEVATGRVFVAGPGNRVVVAEDFGDALPEESGLIHRRAEAARIDLPEVERWLAMPNPLRDRPSGTAGTGDAERVET